MKTLIYTTIVATICCLSQVANAQITIRENNVVERAVLRPQPFDSLTNLIKQKRFIDYKKYIGYQVYFLPKAKNYVKRNSNDKDISFTLFTDKSINIPLTEKIPDIFDGNNKIEIQQYSPRGVVTYKTEIETNVYQPHISYGKREIETSLDAVSGKYFTILDIQARNRLKQEYTKLDDIPANENAPLKFLLLNNSTNDTVYWSPPSVFGLAENNLYANGFSNPFLLVPYFEKQKNMFQNKDMVAMKDLTNLIDVNTGEIVKIKKGDIWNCYDISLIDSKSYPLLQGFCFFKKENEEVMFPIGTIEPSMFITKQEFEKREEERIREEQEKEKARIKFRNDCIEKWGVKIGSYVADGRVQVGMDENMCIAAWGWPLREHKITIKGIMYEQWFYERGVYLYFENNILIAIHD